MTRDDLLALLQAAQISQPGLEILVVGSQSILGAYPDTDLPDRATLSMEADVMYLRDGAYDEELTEIVDAYFGEGSEFHTTHGVYLQGVDESTCVLPVGWRDRLIRLPDKAAAPERVPVRCLDPHDLAVAKIAAGRPKDIEFVNALLTSGHLDPAKIRACAGELDPAAHPGARGDVARRLTSMTKQS